LKEVLVNENDAGQRLDKFLQKSFPKLPMSMMAKAIRNKKIKVNRKRTMQNYRLQSGDIILLFLPEDALQTPQKKHVVHNRPIDIVYEDEQILIVNKPAGLLCQSDQKGDQDCLVARIKDYLITSKQYDPKSERSFSIATANRLDRNTQGLVLAAKTAAAQRILNEAIAQRKIHKQYECEVEGRFEEDASLKLYMKKEETKAKVSLQPLEGYVLAEMDVHVLEKKNNSTLVQIDLHTGRFHQIRACMAYLGYPLCGDSKYGSLRKGGYKLVAKSLQFEDIGLNCDGKTISI
jgi:23S rRNA pseudouridine955/2504/2580 synthase